MTRARIRSALLALSCASAFAPLHADGVAYRVKDLRTEAPPYEPWFEPGDMASLGGSALVALDEDSAGEEVWLSDGTATGMRLLIELTPGMHGSSIRYLQQVGSRVYFSASSPATGQELWITDGTVAGTRLVRDLQPGLPHSDPLPFGVLDGIFYFSAEDGVHGRELWRSDGTPSGTWMVEDIRPGPLSGTGTRAALYHERLYFAANEGQEGSELWRTNGTANGTFRVASLVDGPSGGEPREFAPAVGLLFFTAEDSAHGRELWATDGTGEGTRLVRDIEPGPASSDPAALGAVPGRLLFSASESVHGRELWKSNGSEAGTRLVRDLNSGPADSLYTPHDSGVVDGKLVFRAFTEGSGNMAWVSDASLAGTIPLGVSGAADVHRIGNQVAFGGYDPASGEIALWRTDGTPAGTSVLAPMPSGASYWELSGFARAGSAWVYSFYWDDDFRTTVHELWRTDGTAAGTFEVSNFNPPRSKSYPDLLTSRTGGIVFTALPDGGGWSSLLHLSDGTESGTYAFTPAVNGAREAVPLPDGEALVAAGRLFRTDGDMVSEISAAAIYPAWLTPVSDFVLFAAEDAPHGEELWRTDGTPPGTGLVRDIEPGPTGTHPHDLTAVFDRAWFGAFAPDPEYHAMWESGGTEATTLRRLLDIPIEYNEPRSIVPLDPSTGSFSFRTASALHRFDPAHNVRETIKAIAGHSHRTAQQVLGARLFFLDLDANGDCALFSAGVDGGPATGVATTGCRSVDWSWEDGLAYELVEFGGRLFFQGCEPVSGCELWTSDGTQAGTGRLLDLAPGAFSSMPLGLTEIEGRLYFRACQPASGCEPWVTDGTPPGTHRVADIYVGPQSSLRSASDRSSGLELPPFVASGRLVFFPADDGTGEELWAMPVEIFYDGFQSGDTSRW